MRTVRGCLSRAFESGLVGWYRADSEFFLTDVNAVLLGGLLGGELTECYE